MIVIKYQAMTERRSIGSIPQRTMREVWDGQAGVSARFGGISLRIGGLGTGVSRRTRSGQENSFDVRPYVPPKPGGEKKSRPTLILPENEKIIWQVEQVEDYNGQGDLGLILRYFGIELTRGRFTKSRAYYGLDSNVFSLPVRYKTKDALLFISTFGDIFETQVAVKRDVDPFFREEIHLPELTTTYDPQTMNVLQKNGLVIVSYDLG